MRGSVSYLCRSLLVIIIVLLFARVVHVGIITVFPAGFTGLLVEGFIILLVVHDNIHLQYAALFLAAMGTYSAMPIIVCWFSTNRESDT